jgi:hypothetical protein
MVKVDKLITNQDMNPLDKGSGWHFDVELFYIEY